MSVSAVILITDRPEPPRTLDLFRFAFSGVAGESRFVRNEQPSVFSPLGVWNLRDQAIAFHSAHCPGNDLSYRANTAR